MFQTKLKCSWKVLRKGFIWISTEWLFLSIQIGKISILLWAISIFPLSQIVVDLFIAEDILFLLNTVLKGRKRNLYSWRSTINVIGKCWKVGVFLYLKRTRKWLVRRYTFSRPSRQKYMSIQNGWYLKTEHLMTYLVNMKM